MITRPLILLAPDTAPPSGAPPKSAAAAAPPAPNPAPAPAPPPSTPAVVPKPGEDPGVDEVLADLNRTFDAAEGKGTPAPASEPPKQEGGDAKPSSAAPAASPKPADTLPVEPRTPKELREAHERAKTELGEKSKVIAALEAKIAENERKGLDVTALTKKLESREKEFSIIENELRGRLRALEFEASPEWVKQHKEPFDQSAGWLRDYVTKIAKVDGSATNFDTDVVPLYALAKVSLGQAKAKTIDVFGEVEGGEVFDSIKDLVKIDRAGQQALSVERENWKTTQEKQSQDKEAERVLNAEKTKEQAKQNSELFQQIRQKVIESNPDYRDAPEEKEAAELRAKWRGFADNIPKTVEQQRIFFANIREIVGAFGPQKLKIHNLTKQVADLKAQIEGLKPKPPGGGDSRPSGEAAPAKGDETVDDWARGAKSAVEAAR